MSGQILVFGGGGYIGSHVCYALKSAGYELVIFDNLSNSSRAIASKFGELVEGDIRDIKAVDAVIARVKPKAIMHFAALIEVGISQSNPLEFYEVNVGGTLNILRAMKDHGVENILFSSTCATFGIPNYLPLDEQHPQAPINPYGNTKLAVEWLLRDAAKAQSLNYAVLRYFNAAGAADDQGLGECHDPETHLIPLAIRALMAGRTFNINGSDFPTKDGTCVRDFIHVLDLASAHVKAMEYLFEHGGQHDFNLGSENGISILEVLDQLDQLSDKKVIRQFADRRAGDPPALFASSAKAREALNWTPQYGLSEILSSAWRWENREVAELVGK